MKQLVVFAMVALSGCDKGAAPKPPPVEAPAPAPAPAATVRPDPAAAPTTAELEHLMALAITLFDALGDATDKAGADCDKLAGAFERTLDDYKAFFDEAKRWDGNHEMDRMAEEWMTAHKDRAMGPMMKVMVAGENCVDNAKFMAVMDRISRIGN